jgi:hypothetical protein
MFSFNSSKYNFWPIYETIKKYYPIGISKINSKFYNSYQGLVEFNSIIHDNLIDQNKFKSSWKLFDDIIEEKLKIKPVGTSGFSPSFSSFVEIENFNSDKLTRVKRVHYLISLLGPYYTIIGDDLSNINVGGENKFVTNYMVISPFNEFTDAFNNLATEIENRFNNYRFVPFFILNQTINSLEVPHCDSNPCSVFAALFNNQFDLDLTSFGDQQFKEESWINRDWDKSSQYIAIAQSL